MKSVKEIKKEFEETKEDMFETLNDKLGNIKTTKKELQQFKAELLKRGYSAKEANEEVAKYTINKKLNFVLRDIDIHNRLDDAIAFLDYAIKRKELKDDVRGANTEEN